MRGVDAMISDGAVEKMRAGATGHALAQVGASRSHRSLTDERILARAKQRPDPNRYKVRLDRAGAHPGGQLLDAGAQLPGVQRQPVIQQGGALGGQQHAQLNDRLRHTFGLGQVAGLGDKSISGKLQQRNCQAQVATAACSRKSSSAAPPSVPGRSPRSGSGASPRPPSGNDVWRSRLVRVATAGAEHQHGQAHRTRPCPGKCKHRRRGLRRRGRAGAQPGPAAGCLLDRESLSAV